MEIREGAIDRLVKLYKSCVRRTGGYLTNSGVVNLERVQVVMSDLGEVEDEIFKRRRDTELEFRRRNKQRKEREKRFHRVPAGPQVDSLPLSLWVTLTVAPLRSVTPDRRWPRDGWTL